MSIVGHPAEPLAADAGCFHCGQPVPASADLWVEFGDLRRRMCCAGCQAVCEAIVAGGLADYYTHRKALPESGRNVLPDELLELEAFDNAEFQRDFVRPLGGDEREADLILEGVSCAACVWLNERQIGRLGGVISVRVNYATRRATVRWHEGVVRLSDILAAVAAIGYRAHPYDPDRSEMLAQRERRTALWRLFVAGFGMMQVMMYAFPAYIAGDGDMSLVASSLMRWASMVLTLPVVLYSAAPFFRRALHDLRARHLGMDVPVALGIGAAFAASVWATLGGQGEVYFDSVTMFVFFLLGARYLEMLARQRAMRGAETLGRLIPSFARRLRPDGTVEERVPGNALLAGDVLLVRPGEVIVADGRVRWGESEVNESWLTGESKPVSKREGDQVLGGSLNGSGVLEVLAEQIGEATRLATIRRLMERARNERPRLVELADRVALVFTVVLLLFALLAGFIWWQIEPARVLEVCVAVLVVSCPCALSMATPVALTVATDVLARNGLLVTRTRAIERLASVRHFVFDKTGTLTTGRLRLAKVLVPDGGDAARALSLGAALELRSEHLIAKAIVAAAGEGVQAAEDVRVLPGLGVEGVVAGRRYLLGRAELAQGPKARSLPPGWEGDGSEVCVYLADEEGWLAAFRFADSLRPEAREAVLSLLKEGCSVSILSGDGQATVSAVARALGVKDARGGLSPEEKHVALGELRARHGSVAMLGDGINDAPVLAGADVSVAMSGGTDLARHEADIVLLGDDLGKLAQGRQIVRKARCIIRENLCWAFVYNVLAIPAAMVGWVTPWVAGAGMGLSSLLVVLNALRIARR